MTEWISIQGSLNLERRCVGKRIAGHREIDVIRSRNQSFRTQVENVPTRATERGVEAEIVVWISVAGVLNRPGNRAGGFGDANGVDGDA